MAKMIERALLRIRLSRISYLRSQKNLIQSYLPIREEIIRQRLDRALRWLELFHDAKIAPFAEAAGFRSPADAARQKKVEKIRSRYLWKEKALTQTRKRAEAKGPLSPEDIRRFQDQSRKWTEQRDRRIAGLWRRIDRQDGQMKKQSAVFVKSKRPRTKFVLEKPRQSGNVKRPKSEKSSRKPLKNRLFGRENRHITKTILDRHPSQTGDADLPENVLLRLKNLSMRFGGLLAVDNLSFDVKQGEIFGLIGPNGAGKTTIFNCITRFYRPSSGEMYYRRNAVEVIRLNDFPVHQIIRQGIVRTFQNVELVWELSVLDNLLVAAHTVYRSGFFAQLLHTPGLRREENVLKAKALGVLQTLGLSAYAYAYPYGLPYGILKKIELARTLMANPRLIILDEPAAGLNDKETEELAVLIRKIRDDYRCTIFLVEHDMGLVMNICDTVCAISFGKMLAIGTPAEIQANSLVRGAYLGEQS
jgi:branched-chain amino acid transport system ATP-binding protein